MAADVTASPKVTVIVPCFQAGRYIEKCIGSLLAQTLDPSQFEALFVFNGVDDGSRPRVQRMLERSSLRWRILDSEPGAGAARNRGVADARGAWVTYLDADDQISANYLEVLLASANEPDVLPVAGIVDVDSAGHHTQSPIQSQLASSPTIATGPEIRSVLAMVVLKLIPIELARRYPFNTSLRSGEDVALFAGMAGKEGLRFDTTPAKRGAHYLRFIRPGSISRQGPTYDFLVEQRLDVISELDSQIPDSGNLWQLLENFVRAQANSIVKYVTEHPEELDRVVSAIEARNLEFFPWSMLPVRPRGVFLTDHFSPYAHPAAIDATRRLFADGGPWRVITSDAKTGSADPTLQHLATQASLSVQRLPLEASSQLGHWLKAALEELAVIDQADGGIGEVFSRSSTPAPQILGALARIRAGNGGLWRAEMVGQMADLDRSHRLPGSLVMELSVAIEDAGFVAPSADATAAVWAKTLVFALADEISFTSAEQLSTVSFAIAHPRLRARVLDRATVAPAPRLSERWFRRAEPLALDGNSLNLAYFGEVGPGLEQALRALAMLPPNQVARLRLHVFTADQTDLAGLLDGNPHRARVTAFYPMNYLRLLRSTNQFDVLVLTDGRGGAAEVPTHWADFQGSSTPVWTIAEVGGALSRTESAFKTVLGDDEGARETLAAILAQSS